MPIALPANNQQLPAPITLPALDILPINRPKGMIFHTLRNEIISNIVAIEEVNISPRLKERVYVLENGERLIISSRKKKIIQPANINGVLLIEDDVLKWSSHDLLEKFNGNVNAHGLEKIAKNIHESWSKMFTFIQEEKNEEGEIISVGLRPPQIGGLHAIGAHWSLSTLPATLVMPTGTGKTETMLATLIAFRPGKILIIVPSRILRAQTTRKFTSLGLLRLLKTVPVAIKNPIVGVLFNRPIQRADLQIVDECNVIISTMNALNLDEQTGIADQLAAKLDSLIIDEAHHIAAKTWSEFREKFKNKKIVQFTATPYRRDGKLVDGKVIFNYPLHSAQTDGYFKSISFEPIHNVDEDQGDRDIAVAAVAKLRADIIEGYDHLMMARCEKIERATAIHAIYLELAPDLNPVLVHSDVDTTSSLVSIMTRQSRIVVCVDMLGEGFDLPQLKIAAVHDTHKSLAVLLQFTGRFTRVAGNNIGNATVIANIANPSVSSALERLYSEDADWNNLLSEFSSQAAQTHAALIEFLNKSESLGEEDEKEHDNYDISHHLLHPSLSTLLYRATQFTPENFHTAIEKNTDVYRVWLHRESNTLYFVTRVEPSLKWSRTQEIKDRQWDLFVLHYNEALGVLFLAASDKSSTFEKLAQSVGASQLIQGDNIFRSLANINRLIFQNVGVKKHGRRNLSFAMYTGADVAQALSLTEVGGNSVKSNLSGTGWEHGLPMTIGCSFKGRIWSRDGGTIPELVEFCKNVGSKVIDETISTEGIIDNVLIPTEIIELPDLAIINIEWPVEILRQSEDRVILSRNDTEQIPISLVTIEYVQSIQAQNQIEFKLFTEGDETVGRFILTISAADGFTVTQSDVPIVRIKIGKLNLSLAEFFSNYPPLIRFVDLSEMDGNLHISPNSTEALTFPVEQIIPWDWAGIDIKKESIWKNRAERQDSIQWKASEFYQNDNFDIIFDDDSAGEAADLVCLKEEDDYIRLVLVHCKFTTGNEPGERIKDIVEVCSQAIRSSKWKWKFQDLCRHIISREKRLAKDYRPTRFISGAANDMNKFLRINKIKPIKAEIVIVQPGLSQATLTDDQNIILGATFGYLKETIDVDLELICSS